MRFDGLSRIACTVLSAGLDCLSGRVRGRLTRLIASGQRAHLPGSLCGSLRGFSGQADG